MSHVLVVDDEPSICWGFQELLTDDGHEVSTAPSAEEALALAENCRPDAVILDIRLPGMDGLAAIGHLRERLGEVPIIVITAFGNLTTAVNALDQQAFDYLAKPFDLDEAVEVVRRALAKNRTTSPRVTTDAPAAEEDGLIGSSPAMQEVFKQIALVAANQVPVLITGETGTGKELVAQAIHRHGLRPEGPFVPVCLAALGPHVIESELFGHAKGAFTGAEAHRSGLLELADGGTVLLDEVGDIPLPLQVKLLRAIEHREITPVGETRPRPSDFRVVAATNRPLGKLMRSGHFRDDLFFRLSVFHIELPPLRARIDDIPQLAAFFLERLGESCARKQFTPAALEALRRHHWPGNVRELRNVIERAAIIARGNVIDAVHLPRRTDGQSVPPLATNSDLESLLDRWTAEQLTESTADNPPQNLYASFLQTVEPSMLERVMRHCGHNRTAAARLLGLHRATLREKLRKYGLG